jgi:hypothetical protein
MGVLFLLSASRQARSRVSIAASRAGAGTGSVGRLVMCGADAWTLCMVLSAALCKALSAVVLVANLGGCPVYCLSICICSGVLRPN